MFTHDVLGTTPGNKELAEQFVADKVKEFRGERDPAEAEALKKEEMETIPDTEEAIAKTQTVFHADEKGLFCLDYQWRGFFKERIQHMIELGEVKKLNPWNFRKACDGAIFTFPRRIYFTRLGKIIKEPEGTFQRPIRAMTMRGERIGLANSQLIKQGAEQEVEIHLLRSSNQKSAWYELTMDLLKACLNLGAYSGLMQFRSGGYGRFEWE